MSPVIAAFRWCKLSAGMRGVIRARGEKCLLWVLLYLVDLGEEGGGVQC
jgi:hypothetical protein